MLLHQYHINAQLAGQCSVLLAHMAALLLVESCSCCTGLQKRRWLRITVLHTGTLILVYLCAEQVICNLCTVSL